MTKSVVFMALMVSLLGVGGCAVTHETSVLIGKARPRTVPEQVKLYTKAPAKYEEIAIISADAAHDFMNKQSLLNKSVANLKAEAAKVGANGILLDVLGDITVGSSGVIMIPATDPGMPVVGVASVNARTGKQATGRAIFVIEE